MLQQVEQLDISLEAMILGVGQREACGSLDMRRVVRDSEQHQRAQQGQGPRPSSELVFSSQRFLEVPRQLRNTA